MGLPACALERDVATGLLGRQYGFFLKLIPSACRKNHTARRSVWMPRAASSAVRPRVVKGPAAIRARNQSAHSPLRVRGLWPPIWPGVSAPVSRCRLRHLETQDGLIRKAAAIERIVSPASAR